MRAFIYTAGKGERLGPDFGRKNKILLRFGGKSLLEWHLLRLVNAGVREVFLVTGFDRDGVLEEIDALRPRFSMSLKEIYNPQFHLGSALSLQASLPELLKTSDNLPTLLMDGDVLYPVGMLEKLLEGDDQANLLVDQRYSLADDDPVLVPMDAQGKPFEFVKGWKGESASIGESVGFFCLKSPCFKALAGITEKICSQPNTVEPYEEILREMVLEGAFSAIDITGIPWTEIDFPKDILFAENEVLPAMEKWEVRCRDRAANAM